MLTQPRRPALHLEEVVSQLRLGLGGQELVQAGDPVVRHCVSIQGLDSVSVEVLTSWSFCLSSVPKRIIAGKRKWRKISQI